MVCVLVLLLALKAVLSNEDLALNSYRRAASNQIPKATRIAWTLKKDEIQKSVPASQRTKFSLTNENFETGGTTGPGKYRMNDEAHAKLLNELAKQGFSGASMELHAEMLEFYGHPDAPYATRRNRKAWAKVQAQLEQWNKASPPATARLANDLSGGSPN